MSVVTSVLILTPLGGHPTLDELNVAIAPLDKGEFRDIGEHAGGRKHVQANVYAAAFNYLNWDRFVDIVYHLPWHESTLLGVNFEEDDGFTMWPPGKGSEAPPWG